MKECEWCRNVAIGYKNLGTDDVWLCAECSDKTNFNSLVTPEPPPRQTPEDQPAIWDLVIHDMSARDDFGHDKYGTRLRAGNGRDAMKDAYQEALDLCCYLRQSIYERDGR